MLRAALGCHDVEVMRGVDAVPLGVDDHLVRVGVGGVLGHGAGDDGATAGTRPVEVTRQLLGDYLNLRGALDQRAHFLSNL